MIADAPTASELLTMWERGEGRRPAQRALALLSGISDASEDELAALPIGARDAALLDLRTRLFGNDFTGVTTCPACAETIELTFDANEVSWERARTAHPTNAGETPALPGIHRDGYDVEFRLPTTADLIAIERSADIASARSRLFARCVVRATHDGSPVDASELPPAIVADVAARMAEADPQADVDLPLTCPACAHAWREPFDIVTFLWSELASWSAHLLADVHLLASSYGWSENEILQMPPARRNVYIGMLR